MKKTTRKITEELFERYPSLSVCRCDTETSFEMLNDTFKCGGRLFTCGNGGSAADSEHIVGELMKSFRKKREIHDGMKKELAFFGDDGIKISESLEEGLPAVALTSHIALSTAYSNDREPMATFAQQLYVLGKRDDILIAISTSGNSKNCVYAAIVAKAKGMKVIALTGERESRLSEIADITIKVPERETYKIQELHLPIYHALCASLEEEFF